MHTTGFFGLQYIVGNYYSELTNKKKFIISEIDLVIKVCSRRLKWPFSF